MKKTTKNLKNLDKNQLIKMIETLSTDLMIKDEKLAILEDNEKNLELANEELTKSVKILENQLSIYIEQIKLSQASKFGKKSEKTEQINIFDEVEANLDETILKEMTAIEANNPKKKKKSKKIKDIKADEVIHHTIENKQCPNCGDNMIELKSEKYDEIKYIPGKIKKITHVVHVYKCNTCTSDDELVTFKAETNNKLFYKSPASPSIIAHVVKDKYDLSLPLYRQEQEFDSLGYDISRQTISNWIAAADNDYFARLVELMENDLLKEKVIHMDETTVNDLSIKNKSKCYMWLRASCKDSIKKMAIYNYFTDRKYERVSELLTGYKGYVVSDAYQGYRSDISNYQKQECLYKPSFCWAHARRKFVEALQVNPCDKEYKKLKKQEERIEYLKEHGGYANILRLKLLIDELFKLEKVYQKAKYNHNEIKEERNKDFENGSVISEIFKMASELKSQYQIKSKAGEAFTYLENNKKYLLTYLEDGEIPIENNHAERLIKPFVIGRKNFLFFNTSNGANVSADAYSIVQSAKLNHLKVEAYLEYVLTEMVNGNTDYISLLPYSNSLPDKVRSNIKSR